MSSGRAETPTPSGAYYLTWRSRKRTSTDNDAWILEWYFNFINERGISFHQFDLPGYAASHACVRLLRRDAEWLYGWGEQWQLEEGGRKVRRTGTPVYRRRVRSEGLTRLAVDRLAGKGRRATRGIAIRGCGSQPSGGGIGLPFPRSPVGSTWYLRGAGVPLLEELT